MLETWDFHSINIFPSILGALVDKCCVNDDFQRTKAYNKYVHVVNLIFRSFRFPVWTGNNLEELLQDIIDFKRFTFQPFPALKCQILEHKSCIACIKYVDYSSSWWGSVLARLII